MMILYVIIGAALGAVLNRVRGSKIKGGVWIAAAVFAAGVFWVSDYVWVSAIVVGLLYVGGEAIDGWTAWIWGLQDHMTQKKFNEMIPTFDDTGKRTGGWAFAKLFADPRKDFKKFCIAGMSQRGVVWFAPIFAAFWWFELAPWWVCIVAPLAIGAAMPYSYMIASEKVGKDGKYLKLAEPIFGAVYGGVIGFALGLNV